MKTLIIYVSIHHGNTEKVAKTIAAVLEVELVKPNRVDAGSLGGYSLVGFGSGIYFCKHQEHTRSC